MSEEKSGKALYEEWKAEKEAAKGKKPIKDNFDEALELVKTAITDDLEETETEIARLREQLRAALEKTENIDPDLAAEIASDIEPDIPMHQMGKPDELLIPRFFGGKLHWVKNCIPADCPVKPLGKFDDLLFFLDTVGQVRGISENSLGQGSIANLFGEEIEYLNRNWPQLEKLSKEEMAAQKIPRTKGFAAQYVRDALLIECARKGIFEAREKLRGRGCWKNEDGHLVVHLGNKIIINSHKKPKIVKPGEIDEKVYLARPKVPEPINDVPDKIKIFYERLVNRPWERGEADARLLMGWIGAAVLCGALDWRPMIFILGDAASGKSTLQKEIRMVLEQRVVSTVDASEASLRGLMQNDAISVSFDEIEADASDNGKAERVMKLARYAASGDSVFRSSSDHKVKEFTLLGSMLFSAINLPKMRAQDKQRFCFLKANPFTERKIYSMLGVKDYREIGQIIAARMIAGFARWEETLNTTREILMKDFDHSDRGSLQFGTLLTAFDLLFYDELEPNRIYENCLMYKKDGLVEYEDIEQNFAKYWRVLLSAQPQIWRGNFETVGEIVKKWICAIKGNFMPADDQNNLLADQKRCEAMLERVGLAVIKDKKLGKLWLGIPNDHELTKKLFYQTDLQGGGWMMALRYGKKYSEDNLEGIWRNQQVTLSGVQHSATLIALEALHDFGDGQKKPLFNWKDVNNG